MVSIVGDDKLTTKGDLLVYNTVDSETRLAVGTNDYALLADSGATNGVDWKQVATDTIADDAVTGAKISFIDDSIAATDTHIMVADGTDYNNVAVSGDISLANDGTAAIASGVIVNADVNVSAAIADTKIALGTAIQAYDADTAKTDVDQSWAGTQRGTPSTVTDGTLDLDTANNFKYTPGAADTLEFSNETAGQAGFITLINPSAYTISLGSEVKKGSSWDVSTAGTYLVSYYSDGTSVYVSASEALS
jgi:hypothetical protein